MFPVFVFWLRAFGRGACLYVGMGPHDDLDLFLFLNQNYEDMKRVVIRNVVAVIIALLPIVTSCCTSKSCMIVREMREAEMARARLDSLTVVAQSDTVKWQLFLECSKYEGDAGCDSCMMLIYGFSLEE